MIKPFEWQYPYFVYSKDPYLLESPFPVIAGVSRQLFLKNFAETLEQSDMFAFDLDKGDVYFNEENLATVKFILCNKSYQKWMQLHKSMFNDSKSHIFKIEECQPKSILTQGLQEEPSSEFLEPEQDDLFLYFSSLLFFDRP